MPMIFLIILILLGVIFYIAVFFIYLDSLTVTDIKFRDGGFLGLGWTETSHRDATPKDARKALIWPVLFVFEMSTECIWCANSVLKDFLLIFGYRYENTKLYQRIDRW